MSTEPVLTQHKVTVLLIDDQPMIGEAVRRMLAGEPDIVFHYCRDAAKALDEAHRVKPTVILQDLVMPDIDGLTLVKTFRANEPTRETPMIVLSTKEEPTVKAEAFALGANDYIVKLPDRLELLARIRYHSKGYINLLQRNEAYEALQESQRRLANEVKQAARYVQSLLPEKLKKGDVRTDWRFVPSAELGGDSFGYHWLDDDHFAFYLLDVSGHGVGAALLSVSAMNALRSQALPQTDFRQPSQVLVALNNAFQMDQQNGLFFTIWYGVYHKPTRRIDYSGGGHPPALLVTGPSADAGHARSPRVARPDDRRGPRPGIRDRQHRARRLRQALSLQRRRLRDREDRQDHVAVQRVPRVHETGPARCRRAARRWTASSPTTGCSRAATSSSTTSRSSSSSSADEVVLDVGDPRGLTPRSPRVRSGGTAGKASVWRARRRLC